MSKRIAIPAAIALLVAAGAAIAALPGPKYWGDIYTYIDENGQVVGRAHIDCHGRYHSEGIRTSRYHYGQATCG